MAKKEPEGTSVPFDGVLRHRDDGTVFFVGIDYDTRKMRIIRQTDECVVVHVPGRMCWDGNCQPRKYHRSMMMVFAIVKKLANGDLKLRGLIEI